MTVNELWRSTIGQYCAPNNGVIELGYLSNATVGYVVDNNECLSWEGWARNLSPDKALGSGLQWPPR